MAVSPPGQEITAFESLFIMREQHGQRGCKESQRPYSDGWGANFSCEAQTVRKFVFFKRRRNIK